MEGIALYFTIGGMFAGAVSSTAWLAYFIAMRFARLEINFMKAIHEHAEDDHTAFGKIYDRLTKIESGQKHGR